VIIDLGAKTVRGQVNGDITEIRQEKLFFSRIYPLDWTVHPELNGTPVYELGWIDRVSGELHDWHSRDKPGGANVILEYSLSCVRVSPTF
jgi:hypothetical protein